MELIFEKSQKGKRAASIRPLRVGEWKYKHGRHSLNLPEVAEIDMVRHYTALAKETYGVDTGFYPLGSCTMKYNPKINEDAAALKGFMGIHPLQDDETAQGCLEAMDMLSKLLMEITGMDGMTLAPAAGAHGELTGLWLIDEYHRARGDFGRKKVIVPESAHGTNPASAAMSGFEVLTVKLNDEKGVNLDSLRELVGKDTAALMLTNPDTLGLFEKNIKEIAKIVHGAGGLLYYDGANLNAVMGIVRPGDMGFDVVHLNLHKTFATPHGGGGPGSGPVGCKKDLAPFLPKPIIKKDKRGVYSWDYESKESIGRVNNFYGNFAVCIKALCYILMLGGDGLKEATQTAVLNANYMKSLLEKNFMGEKGRYCMHEFVLSCEEIKKATGVSAMDIAKGMIDKGIHPPTMYFPLNVPEALMIEPTETENKATIDKAAAVMNELAKLAKTDADSLKNAPQNVSIGRADEVLAARTPVLRYKV